mmetsp:Transcript_12896/g.16960  ORF Transcript_12896/g.16960 Transcript_12896/m.16960 type:complete len:492 (+) Transcript_12896:34-1509(+)
MTGHIMRNRALLSWLVYFLLINHHIAVSEIQSLTQHQVSIAKIAEQVQQKSDGQLLTIKRAKAHSHCPRSNKYKAGTQQVDISSLDNIVGVEMINEHGPYCAIVEVEPLVTMEQLVKELLPMGLMPAVVPEFRKMTVGGAIQGLAAESSSFKYGFLHDVCTSFELVLGTGEVITATAKNKYSDLFKAIPGSYGSLALMTSAKILCIPATESVVVESRLVSTPEEFLAEVQNKRSADKDFLEGIAFGPEHHCCVSAKFVDKSSPEAKLPLKHLHRSLSPWFFKLIQKNIPMMSKEGVWQVRIPTEDYLFRHDRGAFWMASYRIPHPIGRLMGPALDSRRMFQMADMFPFAFPKSQILLQDFMLPRSTMPAFVKELTDKLSVWPLWYLPMNNCQEKGHIMSMPGNCGDVCNVGAYGIPKKKFKFKEDNIFMEEVLTKLGGRKVFYSHAYYSREDFYGKLYNGTAYRKIRSKYGADAAFKEVYDKVITKGNDLG